MCTSVVNLVHSSNLSNYLPITFAISVEAFGVVLICFVQLTSGVAIASLSESVCRLNSYLEFRPKSVAVSNQNGFKKHTF